MLMLDDMSASQEKILIDYVTKQVRHTLSQALKSSSSKDTIKTLVANTLANISDVIANVDVVPLPSRNAGRLSRKHVEKSLAYAGSILDDLSIVLNVLDVEQDPGAPICDILSFSPDAQEMYVNVKMTYQPTLALTFLSFRV